MHTMNFAVRVVALLLLSVQVFAEFKCSRDQGLCKNGATCNQADTCDCVPDYTGYDCSILSDNVGMNDCTDESAPCQNGGTCHDDNPDDGGSFTCLCPEMYIGGACGQLRYKPVCGTDPKAITVHIKPFVDTFNGAIFAVGHFGESSCTAADPDADNIYSLELENADATCDVTTDEAGTSKRCYYVIFSDNIYKTNSQKICAVCGGGDTLTKTGTVDVTDLDTNIDKRTIGTSPLDEDVGFAVINKATDAPIGDTVPLGALLQVEVALSEIGLGRFLGSRIESCNASNGVPDGDVGAQSGFLVQGSCESNDLRVDISNLTANSFGFESFRFINTDTFVLICVIKACTLSSDCDPVACDARRKKRQADEGPSVNKVLSRKYTIGEPHVNTGEQDMLSEEPKACYQTWEMTATVVALAVALVLVLVLCMVLVIKAILNRKSKYIYRDNSSCVSSTDPLPHLPKIVSDKC